jgi:beta-lactamase regulating signal transducer with metallopeptidase domain
MNMTLSFASALSFALLHSLWQVALVALLAALSFSALPRAHARVRHTLGMVWLVAMLVAPVVTFFIYWYSPSPVATAEVSWAGAWQSTSDAANLAATLPAPPWHHALLVCLSPLWLAGVLLMAVRQLGGWRLIRRIEAQPFMALPPQWQCRVAVLAAVLGITRRVSVRLAQHVMSPFTTHALRPLIWLPLTLLSRLPANQIEALLAHELAHIRRLDWCWNALQCVIEMLLFHHPAMWWLSRRIREEREHACDDLAVAACGDAIALAEALAGLQRHGRPPQALMHGLAAEGGTLLKRISHLLSAAPTQPNWRVPGALLLLLCGSSLVAMQIAPPAHLLTNLTTDASSSGELTPGHHREVTASYLGEKQRRYRVSMDTQGQIDEVYTEEGQPRPVDAGVRRWLASMQAMEAAGTPPKPAAAPPAPLPPLPLDPLEAPASPKFASAEALDLMDTIRSDSRLVAITGLPVTFDRQSFHGNIRTWGSRDFHLWGIDDPVRGQATFSMTFQGPKASVNVRYAGRTTSGGVWKADTLDLSPLPR